MKKRVQNLGSLTQTSNRRWRAYFNVNKERYYVGCFDSREEALLAVKDRKQELGITLKLRQDLTGKTFGRLEVLCQSGKDRHGRLRWECRCDCGKTKIVDSRHLVQGSVVSCGCYSIEISTEIIYRLKPWKTGAACHLYNPNLTEEDRQKRRGCPRMAAWRRKVFARDNYTCDLCKQRGVSIAAHHLNGWASYKAQRYLVKNGITLCKSCHVAFHLFNGGPRVPCTRKQYYKYKHEKQRQ